RVRLRVRRLDQNEAMTTLAGTEGAANPFFSPDSQWIAFRSGATLKKISVDGGAPVTLCDVQALVGGSWGDDGNIIACLGLRSGLSRIPPAGGSPTPMTVVNTEKGEIRHSWPHVLPGSQAVLFSSYTVAGGFGEPNVEVVSLKNGERKRLLPGFFA